MPTMGSTNPPPLRRWYSTTAAARALGVSVGTVQHMVEDGRLRAWKTTGGHRRIDGLSLEALVNEPAQRSPSLRTNGHASIPSLLIYGSHELQLRWSKEWLAQHATQWQIELFDEPMGLLLALSNLHTRYAASVLLLDLVTPTTENTQRLLAQLATIPELWPRYCVLGLAQGSALPVQPEYNRWVCFQPLTPDLLQGYLTALQMHIEAIAWLHAPP